jgi:hypothetical protein
LAIYVQIGKLPTAGRFSFNVLYNVINLHTPVHATRIKNNDKPWITAQFKALIAQRNEAFSRHDTVRYNMLRNRTNHLRRFLQQRFYHKHVEHCKQENSYEWWKAVKKLCGIADGQESNLCNLTFFNEVVDNNDLANVINGFLVAVAKDVPVFNSDKLSDLRAHLPIVPIVLLCQKYLYLISYHSFNVAYVSTYFKDHGSVDSTFMNQRQAAADPATPGDDRVP